MIKRPAGSYEVYVSIIDPKTGKVLVNKHKGPRGMDLEKSKVNWKGGKK